MTSVSQIIPNYATGGISDQPDELKKPGQLRDCLNAYPDIVQGLYRRPGFELIGELQDKCDGGPIGQNGTWFPFIRQNPVTKTQENYLIYINNGGQVHVFDDKGAGMDVYHSVDPIRSSEINGTNAIDVQDLDVCEKTNYFKHRKRNALKPCTVNNYTVVSNPESIVTMSSKNDTRPFEAFIEVTNLVYNREYIVKVDILDGDDDSTKFTRATDVEIIDIINNGSETNEDASCPGQHRDTYEDIDDDFLYRTDDRGQEGLVVEIETTGRQKQSDGDRIYCIYSSKVNLISGGRNWREGDKFRIYASGNTDPVDENDIGYIVEVTDVETIYDPADYVVTGVRTPSSGDESTSVNDVLNDLRKAIHQETPLKQTNIEVVGNGLYLTHDEPFTISTSEMDLMNILANTDKRVENPYVIVNNVSRLPIECKDGLIAMVSNAFTDDDDYWVQFDSNYGESKTQNKGDQNDYETSASGYWKEVPEPGTDVRFNSATMPHVIAYTLVDDKPAFVVGPIRYKGRKCGDEDFNPSFNEGNVNNVHFYRNRLVFLSQENLVMSVAGDLFNFFPSSAIGVAASDPIDLSVSTNYSSVLQDAVVINNGMVLFSKYQQFMLNTSNDILSPATAKISEISRYEFDIDSRPISLGTNIGFMGLSTTHSKFYELTNVFTEGPVDIIERSKIIANTIVRNLDLIADSKDTGVFFLGRRSHRFLYGYRYFKEGNQNDVQAAWFRWELPADLVNHFIIDGDYYAVLDEGGASRYVRLKLDGLPTDGPFMDYWREDGDTQYEQTYLTKLEFPTVNVLKAEQQAFRADTTSSLVVHRLNYNFADIGSYEFVLKRDGMDNHTILYESRYMDAYEADEDPLVLEVERTVPVYTRNTSLDVTLKSDFPHPLVLRSMRWEGDYNQRYYKRV